MNLDNICYTQYQVELQNQLRLLWNQHVFWTRSFIISTASDLGDLDAVTKRLLQNPSDFGKVFQMFYDEQTVTTFVDLFTQHLLIAADLVNAAKRNDSNAVSEAQYKWYNNADDMSAFFASINPYWSEQIWRDFLYSHLQMTEQEATLRLSGKYAEDVKLFDMIELEALKMADYMFYGLLNCFIYQ